jgi:uncharacterized protein YukE
MSGNGYSFAPVCRAGVGQGTIYDQFHNNVKGDSPLHDNASVFTALAGDYQSHQQDLTQALSGIKATYTGTAADQMEGAFAPLIKSMSDGQTMCQQASASMTAQAAHFTGAQNKIDNTVPVPDQPWYAPVDPWSTDHDDAVAKNNDINNTNNAAYAQYGTDAGSNVQTFPPFTDKDTMNANSISVSSNPLSPVGNGSGGYSGSGGGGGGYSPHGVGSGSGGGSGSHLPNSGSNGGSPYQPNPITTPGGGNPYQNPNPGGPSTGLQGSGPGSGGYPPGSTPWSGPGIGGTGGTDGGGFGPGGFGGFDGAGGFGGAKGAMGAGASAGAKPGAGNATGVGAAGEEGGMGSGPGAAAGARGAAGSSGMMGGQQGRSGKKEDDREHKSAAYLVSESNEIVGDLPATLPPGGVIGD